MTHLIQELRRRVEEWGGRLELVNDVDEIAGNYETSGVSPAPFEYDLGVSHKRKIIYYEATLLQRRAAIGGLVHEAAHVFACRDEPGFSEEYDFLGWEWLFAREVGLLEEWMLSMNNYALAASESDYSEDFEYLSDEARSDLFEERYQHAEKLGLIVDGRCVSIRS